MASATRTASIIAVIIFSTAFSLQAQVRVDVQLHGAPLMTSLHAHLASIDGYSFEPAAHEIVALDRATGEQIYSITHPDFACLTFTGALFRLQSPTLLQRSWIRQEIDRYNSSADVGTMYYDETTGEVSMRHHLNPGQAGVRSMVEVARRFGSQVIAGRTSFSRIDSL